MALAEPVASRREIDTGLPRPFSRGAMGPLGGALEAARILYWLGTQEKKLANEKWGTRCICTHRGHHRPGWFGFYQWLVVGGGVGGGGGGGVVASRRSVGAGEERRGVHLGEIVLFAAACTPSPFPQRRCDMSTRHVFAPRQHPDSRGVRVALGTGYNRGRGIGRARRTGGVCVSLTVIPIRPTPKGGRALRRAHLQRRRQRCSPRAREPSVLPSVDAMLG
jgi:hypothetical protein